MTPACARCPRDRARVRGARHERPAVVLSGSVWLIVCLIVQVVLWGLLKVISGGQPEPPSPFKAPDVIRDQRADSSPMNETRSKEGTAGPTRPRHRPDPDRRRHGARRRTRPACSARPRTEVDINSHAGKTVPAAEKETDKAPTPPSVRNRSHEDDDQRAACPAPLRRPAATVPLAPWPRPPTSDVAPRPVSSKSSSTRTSNAQLPLDTPLRDEEGRRVTLGDYFGAQAGHRTCVYYECPMLCNARAQLAPAVDEDR